MRIFLASILAAFIASNSAQAAFVAEWLLWKKVGSEARNFAESYTAYSAERENWRRNIAVLEERLAKMR